MENEPDAHFFQYRYAVYRAGKFHHFEVPADFITEEGDNDNDGTDKDDAAMEDRNPYHRIPLRLLANREQYVVNDVMGKTVGHPDIDLNRLDQSNQTQNTNRIKRIPSASTLHSRNSSFGQNSSFASLASKGSGSALSTVGTAATTARKKAVGFAPGPPIYHRSKTAAGFQPVHLNPTDGLVVVSAFLPVILHRSDQGEWTADWDYEALLSMQTHLRVTRIGVVKWRGWHGNSGGAGSPEAGVPIGERGLVEDCLRPFNCVPVWMDTSLFGEM